MQVTRTRSLTTYDLPYSWKYTHNIRFHSLHSISSRTGAFPAPLARYFILRYSKPGDIVLDPFSGKGTAPLEACIHGRIGIGNDVSPEAYVLTKSKVRPVDFKHVLTYTSKLKSKISAIENTDEVPESVSVFYHEDTLKQIVSLKKILNNDSSVTANFVKALLYGILHGASEISLSVHCSHFFSMAPNYARKYIAAHRLKPPSRDVILCIREKAIQVLVDGLPKQKGYAFARDAAKIPIPQNSVDLIITSPPYFNKQTYAWDNWLRLWFLGHDYRDIGKRLFSTGSLQSYFSRMKMYLQAMFNVLKDDSVAIIVIGDVRTRDGIFNTAYKLSEIAEQVGFSAKPIIEDRIKNHSLNHLYNPSNENLDRHGRMVDRILMVYKGHPKTYNNLIKWSHS